MASLTADAAWERCFEVQGWKRGDEVADIELWWVDPRPLTEGWEFDDDGEPHFEPLSGGVVQRDFGAWYGGLGPECVVARPDTEDGLANALRWFLPPLWARRGALLLHSAAVVDRQGQCRVFLGPSGVGKTTLALRSGDRRVLGDDMNLVELREGQGWVSPVPLGQKISQGGDGRWPLKDLWWLGQGPSTRARPKALHGGARLVSSVLQPEQRLAQRVVDLAAALLARYGVGELDVSLSGDPWEVLGG